jgi:hypothetical protein
VALSSSAEHGRSILGILDMDTKASETLATSEAVAGENDVSKRREMMAVNFKREVFKDEGERYGKGGEMMYLF